MLFRARVCVCVCVGGEYRHKTGGELKNAIETEIKAMGGMRAPKMVKIIRQGRRMLAKQLCGGVSFSFSFSFSDGCNSYRIILKIKVLFKLVFLIFVGRTFGHPVH